MVSMRVHHCRVGVLQILGAGFVVIVASCVAVWFGGIRTSDRRRDDQEVRSDRVD